MSVQASAIESVTRRLPAAISSRIDLQRRNLPGLLGPMNGQALRQQMIRDLFASLEFDLVVETGTFRAETTRFFAELTDCSVETAEINPRFLRYSQEKCRNFPNIKIHGIDSRAMLRDLEQTSISSRPFIYLDAHWDLDVPRQEELSIIRSRWPLAVVLVDDFFVPKDPSFGFAMYGGRRLDLSYLPDMPGWTKYYPSYPSLKETGAKRGFLLLAGPERGTSIGDATSLLRHAEE